MIVVNHYAGPGAGKSTLAAAVFAELKWRGVSAELVTEFAKDCAWEGRSGPFRCQPYMFGEQLWRLERLRDRGVEIAITDSPIDLSIVYARPDDLPFKRAVMAEAARFEALDIFVHRVKPYETRGRLHSEAEAKALDETIHQTFAPFDAEVRGRRESVSLIADLAEARLKESRGCLNTP